MATSSGHWEDLVLVQPQDSPHPPLAEQQKVLLGRPVLCPLLQVTLTMDASFKGWREPRYRNNRATHIIHLELIAFSLTLRAFYTFFKAKEFSIQTNNMTAINDIQKQTQMSALAMDNWDWATWHHMQLMVEH